MAFLPQKRFRDARSVECGGYVHISAKPAISISLPHVILEGSHGLLCFRILMRYRGGTNSLVAYLTLGDVTMCFYSSCLGVECHMILCPFKYHDERTIQCFRINASS